MNTSNRRGLGILLVALVAVTTGCARTSAVPVGADTIQIAVRVATICDAADADRLARRHAAVETIRRGFQDFAVVDSVGGDHMAEQAPETARTNLFGAGAAPLFSEDAPLLAHHRVLTVRMFHAGEGESETTVSARAVLGDDWEARVTKGAPATCLGVD